MDQFFITADPVDSEERRNMLLNQICYFRPELKKENLKIQRTEKGKPFPVYGEVGPVSDLHVSVSHSGRYWACVLSDQVCGLDLQEMRPADHGRLAARFFRAEEETYIKEAGLAGFYELWTRREALAKYTGLGFFGMSARRPQLVDSFGQPADRVQWDGELVVFERLPVPEGYMAVWCHKEEGGL